MHHVRKVPTAEWESWATITDIVAGETRRATEDELLQLGMVEILRSETHVWVDCAIVEWRARPDLPGSVVAEGFGVAHAGRPSRFEQLPASVRGMVLRAGVRAPGLRRGEIAGTRMVPIAEVRPDDVVMDAVLPPHRWHV